MLLNAVYGNLFLAFFNLGSWLRHSVAAAGTEFKDRTGTRT